MENRELMRIEDGRGKLVHVRGGAVWITQEGDGRDYYVPAGASFSVTRNGRTVIAAIGRASIAVTSACEPVERKLGARLASIWTGLFAPHARPTTAGL